MHELGCDAGRLPASLMGGIMEGAPRPNPKEKLVRVFDTEQESEALVVRGLLESAGIESDLTSLDAQQDILPGIGGTIILVREEVAAPRRPVCVLHAPR